MTPKPTAAPAGADTTSESLPSAEPQAGAPARPVLFDAVLMPHRSLSTDGARKILIGFFLVSFAAGIVFVSRGWWPIAGYFGLDVLLLWWAFRASHKSGRLVERLHLTGEALTVARIHPNGASVEWSFQPAWLRVDMDDPPEHKSQLTLSSHGRAITVGRFLTPAERLEVAQALRRALATARQPLIA